jgi:hypothetical protein
MRRCLLALLVLLPLVACEEPPPEMLPECRELLVQYKAFCLEKPSVPRCTDSATKRLVEIKAKGQGLDAAAACKSEADDLAEYRRKY